MDNFYIAATKTSPEIDFRFDQNALSIKGESYPENAAAFFAPVIDNMRAYLAGKTDAVITIDVALTYFNSSSTKMLFSIFDALDESAQAGNRVVMNWYRDEEDETIAEFGEELKADFSAIEFTDRPVTY
jgi:ABC-type amino acid transport substrate-binding protein